MMIRHEGRMAGTEARPTNNSHFLPPYGIGGGGMGEGVGAFALSPTPRHQFFDCGVAGAARSRALIHILSFITEQAWFIRILRRSPTWPGRAT
jgi:hypothetical protein